MKPDCSCFHEAGHLTVGLRHCLPIQSLRITDLKLNVEMPQDAWWEKVQTEAADYLAGGVAGELIKCGCFDSKGSNRDRQQFLDAKLPGAFDDYIDKARSIIELYAEQFEKLAQAIQDSKEEQSLAANAVLDPLCSLLILSGQEISSIWKS